MKMKDLWSYYQSLGSEFRYTLGKVLGTQNRPTIRLASYHCVLNERNSKSLYIKIVDESILFFSKVFLSIFSLEVLYISWVERVFILEWEWNAKSQVFRKKVGWWLGLATWLSREFKLRANRIARLDFLSCSALADVTIHLLCMLHSCASFGSLPTTSQPRVPVASPYYFVQTWAFLHTPSHTTLTWFPPKYRVTNC